MKSDLESLKETGGSGPAPKPFTPPELKKEWVAPVAPPPPKITPADFSSPKENLKVEMEKELTPIIEEEPASGKGKKVLLFGGVVIIAIGVGLLGYFVLFPMLFPVEVPPPPAITQPTTEIPEIPAAETETPAATHQSLLQSSDKSIDVALVNLDLASLTNALKQESQSLPAGSLTEINLTTVEGAAMTSQILPLLIPELSEEKTKNLFEEDFTLALFSDVDGVWPSYILKLSPNSNLIDGQNASRELESSAGLSNLFLSSPGTPSAAGFKSGQANGLSSRYLTYSQKGAALNIAWSGDKLVISTSYNGLKKVLTNL